MNNENNELFNNVKISTGEEEIVLAPPMEFFEEAKQIEQNTKSNKKFPFMIHYDVNQREFLLSILETVGAIMEDDDDDGHILATMMNMTQLAFIKQLDCVERVESDEGTNPHIEYSETESETIEEDNNEGMLAVSTMESANNSDINDLVSNSEISTVSATTSERSSCCTCPPANSTMETAKEISCEGSYSGYIGSPGDEQWFKFTTTQSAKYTIYTTGSLDTIGTLCDSCGIPIIEVDDYEPSGSVNFRLNRRLSANTTYYIKVRIDKNGTGSYFLNLTQKVIADFVSISPDTIVLEKGVTYELPITPNYTYKGFNGAQRIPDLSVSLTPSNATEQKISWSSSGDVIEVIWPDDADGDLYIHVTAKNNGTATLFAKDWNSNGKHDECTVTVVTPYEKRLQDLGGFSRDEINLILKVYDKVDTIYTTENTLEKAWRCARVLSEFSYDYLTYGINSWNCAAGSVTTDVGEEGEVDRKAYFVGTLGFTSSEYDTLDKALTRNHANKEGNTNIIDFTHMQYALAARLAYSLDIAKNIANWGPIIYTGNIHRYTDEDVSYLGGWFGDAILTNISGEGQTFFANDDYMSDLDAENIYRLILQGKSSIEAINEYYYNMTESNTRANIFLQYIPYSTVKQKIFYELIDAQLYMFMSNALSQEDTVMTQHWRNLINNEQYHFDEIKTRYPDTYNFLKSLEYRLLTIGQYA